MHMLTTVDREVGTGDITGVLVCQESNHAADLFRISGIAGYIMLKVSLKDNVSGTSVDLTRPH